VAGKLAKRSTRGLQVATAAARKVSEQKAAEHPVLGLQQTAGNDAVAELLRSMPAPGTKGRPGLDPRNRQAWSFLGGGNIRKKFPEEFQATLAAAPEAELAIEERLKRQGAPQGEEQLEAFESELRAKIRMRALGLMATHRASIEGRRDETRAAAAQGSKAGGKGPGGEKAATPTPDETAAAIRAAAAQVVKFEELTSELRDLERRIDIVRRQVLVSGRSEARIEAWVDELDAASRPYRSDAIRERWNQGMDDLVKARFPDAMAAPLWKLALALRSWRLRQIARTRAAIGQIYEAFPFFAQLGPSEIAAGKHADTPALMNAVDRAYARLLENVDEAIVAIGSGDIDPYDLPVAMAQVRADLPQSLHPAFERLMREHHTREFWKSMGLGLFQAVVVFVPVVGPAIAVGVGAAQWGVQLEGMLDRVVMAGASTTPEGTTLGVGAPGAFEWAMLGVDAILTAADFGPAVRELRAPAAGPRMRGGGPPVEEGELPTQRAAVEGEPRPKEPVRREPHERPPPPERPPPAGRPPLAETARVPVTQPTPAKRTRTKAEKRKQQAAEKERLHELEREEQRYAAGDRPDELRARQRELEERQATGAETKRAAKTTPERAGDVARAEAKNLLAKARAGEFRSWSTKRKRELLRRYTRLTRRANVDSDLVHRPVENKMVGDFYEALDMARDRKKWTGTQKTLVAGAPIQPGMKTKKPTSRTPAAAVRPDQEGQLVLPDGRVLRLSREQKMFRWLEPNAPEVKDPTAAARVAAGVRRELEGKTFNLRTGQTVVLRMPFDPDDAVREAMLTEFFKPGSPIREVVFGDRAIRNPAFP
jgi:hypothetical protein